MYKSILIGLTFVIPNIFLAQQPGTLLFDDSILHRIDLRASQLEAILLWPAYEHPGPVQLIFDGQVVDSVYLRRKGYTSNEFNNTNPPFKIDIDKFVDGKDLDGLDILNLHNHHLDDTYQRNALSYALYRRAGVPAPRTSFAEVFINGKFIDIYTITEDIDKDFLKQNFASDEGSLYKGVEFPVDGALVNKGSIDAFQQYKLSITPENWGQHADLHNFLRVILVDHLINTDPGGQNDYMYFEPKSKKMHLITWDHNFSYNGDPSALDAIALLQPKVPFFDLPTSISFIQSPSTRILYLETLCQLMGYLLDEEFIHETTENFYTVLNSGSQGISIEPPNSLRTYMQARKNAYLMTLAELGYTQCQELNEPSELTALVINEFVAKSDKNGILNPNGENADWIELYNNSGKDIVLDKNVYLSNAAHFLKKWHFDKPTTIPANGYIILWADKNIDQTGIHTNFKLNADYGQIYLSFENLNIIQAIDYGPQKNNLASARIPNGVGGFVIQPPTPSMNNETSSSSNLEINHTLQILPNPSSGLVQIMGWDNFQFPSMVTVMDATGKKKSVEMLPHGFIHLTDYTEGIYWIIVFTESGMFSGKLVLMRDY